MRSSIRRLAEADVEAVVAFSLAAWEPVYESFERQLGPEVYGLIYPNWRSTQAEAVIAACTEPENEAWVAVAGARPVGFAVVRYLDEGGARAGEIFMVAVDPEHQNEGIGAALTRRAVEEIESTGAELAVVATGDDPGHAPARALYEKLGFKGFGQVRYYRRL